jgi:hypothetical protein
VGERVCACQIIRIKDIIPILRERKRERKREREREKEREREGEREESTWEAN